MGPLQTYCGGPIFNTGLFLITYARFFSKLHKYKKSSDFNNTEHPTYTVAPLITCRHSLSPPVIGSKFIKQTTMAITIPETTDFRIIFACWTTPT